jgi:hypothetical protein
MEGREKGNDGQGERKRILVKGREHMPLMHCNRKERKKSSTLGRKKEGDFAKGGEHTDLRDALQ